MMPKIVAKYKKAEDVGVWCCEHRWRCKWQGARLSGGLAWGNILESLSKNDWRAWHDRMCGGRLIQLVEPTTIQSDRS